MVRGRRFLCTYSTVYCQICCTCAVNKNTRRTTGTRRDTNHGHKTGTQHSTTGISRPRTEVLRTKNTSNRENPGFSRVLPNSHFAHFCTFSDLASFNSARVASFTWAVGRCWPGDTRDVLEAADERSPAQLAWRFEIAVRFRRNPNMK